MTAPRLDLQGEGLDPVIAMGGKRARLWQHAIRKITESPWIGYGVVPFGELGFEDGFPPHNMLFIVMIYGGVLAGAGLAGIFITAFYSLLLRSKRSADCWPAIILLLWVCVQGCFTNLLIGDPHIGMLLWLVVALFSTPACCTATVTRERK
ncbi:MAG: hypothetical protein IH830_13435 [Planctomycetes bacterium]|nr:hypothetical protein [Planctomycetota bacterium]